MGQPRKRGGVWWVRYCRNGHRFEESARSEKRQAAVDLLKIREGDVAKGVPVSARVGQLRFEVASKALTADYTVSQKRSVDYVQHQSNARALVRRPPYGGDPVEPKNVGSCRSNKAAKRRAAVDLGQRKWRLENATPDPDFRYLSNACARCSFANSITTTRSQGLPLDVW